MVMSQNLVIKPASPDHFDVLPDWLYNAKLNLTVNRLLYKDWPNEANQRQHYRGAIEGGAKDPNMTYHLAVDVENEPLGFLVLARKQVEDQETARKEEQRPTDFMNEDVFAEVIRATSAVAAVTNAEAHVDIVYVYVKSSARRKGVGAQLIKFAQEQARTAGLPLATCAEPESLPFFLSEGLSEIVHEDMDLRNFAAPYTGFGVFRLTGVRWQG